MGSRKYQVNRIIDSESEILLDSIVIEAPLQININKEAYTVVMRTPGQDEELIRGLLYAEDIYKAKDNLEVNYLDSKPKYHDIVELSININKIGKGYLNKRSLLSVSSCGICGKQDLEGIKCEGTSLNIPEPIPFYKIEEWFEAMKQKQVVFEKTGGLHAMMALNSEFESISLMEDIGRHNALDKVVGDLLNRELLKQAKILLVSGRVSYEIISKAFIAKIPVVIAVSACSSLAIDFAKEFGICLIGFARGKKGTIYSNPQYILK